MGVSFGPSGSGGAGGGGLHFRSPPDEFTGANLAACRTARDTAFSTGGTLAAVLAEYQGDQSLAIILNPSSSADNVFETYTPGQVGVAYAAAQWVARTDAVQGNPGTDGDDGSQGRFEIIIHINASSTPTTPTGGSYDVAAGTLTPPTGWTEAPTVPGTGEDVYASQAVIDPETQSGTVTPVWSIPVERSHLSSGISHVETSADFTGTGIAGDVLGLANPLTPNPSDTPTEALLSIKYGSTVYNVDEVLDVTSTGLPVIAEANHRSLFIDYDTPRVWIGHRIHHARVDAMGTFADYSSTGYLGALSSAPGTTTVGQSYYDTSRHAWYSAPAGGVSGVWRQTALSSLISGGRWLGELSDDATAGNSIVNFVTSNTYVYYNTTAGTIRVLDSSTYVAPQDPQTTYQVEPISAPGGIVSAITGLTAGAGLSGGGTSGVVSVSVDETAADFPTIPLGKGGTGATDAVAARTALAVLTQAQVDARAVSRFTDAEKTKLNNLMAGVTAIDLGTVTLSADRITAVAPSGYVHYGDGTLLIFRVGTYPDPSWTGDLSFYIGTDRYDLHKSATANISYSDFRTDTTYLAIVETAVQLLGPFDPTDPQIGDTAFSNPPSDLTDTEKTAVRTAVGSASIADVLTQILVGTGIAVNRSVNGQITLTSTVTGGSADGTLSSVVLDVAAGTIVFTSTVGSAISLDISGLATDSELSAYAPLASPVLTGTPTADTATAGTSTTQLATTAFVTTAGFTLRSAAGAPAQALGDDDDWYINRTTGGFYEKVSGSWELRYTDQVGAGGGLTQSQVDARADTRIGVALAAAVTSNTETGIVVTYNTSDGTIDFVIQAAAQTHTNFVGITAGELSAVVIADFTVSGVTAALTIPAYSGSRRLLFARPASEADPSAVYLYLSGNRNTTNQFSIFTKSVTTIQLGGEAHNWWGTVGLQSGAGGYVLEQVS